MCPYISQFSDLHAKYFLHLITNVTKENIRTIRVVLVFLACKCCCSKLLRKHVQFKLLIRIHFFLCSGLKNVYICTYLIQFQSYDNLQFSKKHFLYMPLMHVFKCFNCNFMSFNATTTIRKNESTNIINNSHYDVKNMIFCNKH